MRPAAALMSTLAGTLLATSARGQSTSIDGGVTGAPPDGGAMDAAAPPLPPPPPPSPAPRATRSAGPAGSLLIVEESHAVPLVHLELAARSGSAADPRGNEGLINLAAELARRGAAGRTREALDEALDALGARLDVVVEPDSVRFVGEVLARNLDPFLALLADVVLRPDFTVAELGRTRREIQAQLDENRNDDRALCSRYFERRLYGDHPYGRASDGTEKSLARLRRAEVEDRFRAAFAGRNLIFGAAGDVTPDAFQTKITRAFAGLQPGAPPAPAVLRQPLLPDGWRIQLVDKPDRQFRSQPLYKRWQDHCRGDKQRDSYLHRAIAKYGIENFSIEQIDFAETLEQLNLMEETYIKAFNCLSPIGYNLLPGGKNRRAHQETRNKISEKLKGREILNRWSKGRSKPHSEETKEKLSEMFKGKPIANRWTKGNSTPRTKEQKAHLNAINKGKPNKVLYKPVI